MVRNYKRKTNRGLHGNWSKNDLDMAMAAVESKVMSLSRAASEYGIPRSTLGLKIKGWKNRKATGNVTSGGGGALSISLEQETLLASRITLMNKWGFGLTRSQVLDVVEEYVIKNNIKTKFWKNRPGPDWFRLFCSRHQLSLKKPEILEGSRARQSNDPFIIYDFFEKLTLIVDELGLKTKPRSIFNCDESGFKSDPTTSKVLSKIGDSAKRITGGNARKTTTVLTCVNADGQKMPPLILHQGKRLWDSMMGDKTYPGTSYFVSENGWMTEKVFLSWFKNQFCPFIEERPVLMIYDGHLSHISLELIETAIENQVTILKLPPHTSHILQPLDVCVFRGVKSRWDKLLCEWVRHNPGKILPKNQFANLLGEAWLATTGDVIKNGFKKTGIFDPDLENPVNNQAIDHKNFDPNKLKRYFESKMSSQNAQMPSNVEEMQLTNEPNTAENQSESNLIVNAGENSFESILLKTVTPTVAKKGAQKTRIDVSEVITSEEYLQKLKSTEAKKTEILAKKLQKKVEKDQKAKKKMEETLKKQAERKEKARLKKKTGSTISQKSRKKGDGN